MLLSLALLAVAADPVPPFRVVGYLPNYRADAFDPVAARRLTDLTVFSAVPTAAGDLDLSKLKAMPWEQLRTFKTRERVRLVLCVGGWTRSAHFPTVAGSADKRAAFARNAVRVCLEQRFDGLDLDWEHPASPAEQDGYGELLAELKRAFRPHGLGLTVTVAGWQKLTPAAVAAADWMNLMAYDHPGRHSAFDAVQKEVEGVLAAGVPAGKLTLGIPLYGRHVEKPDRVKTYRELLADGPLDGDERDGFFFNGPATVRRKTDYALATRLGGVMVWEVGQDAAGDAALLKVIRDTVDRRP